MSCRVLVRRDFGGAALTEDQIATLLDLARGRDEITFKELAGCLGVRGAALDQLWMRTLARLAATSSQPSVL